VLENNFSKEKNSLSVLHAFDMNKKMKIFKDIFKRLAVDSVFFHANSPEFYPVLQVIESNLLLLNEKNIHEYQYISKKYTQLAQVMEILADEAYQSKISEHERKLRGRIPQLLEMPEHLNENEKCQLIRKFFNNAEYFEKKIFSLKDNGKINYEVSQKAIQELEDLKTDDALAKELFETTDCLENRAEDSVRADTYDRVLPFRYRDAAFNSAVVQFILHRGYSATQERNLDEDIRETDPNKLQELLSSSIVEKTFSKKEIAIVQRLMSARIDKENQIFSTLEFFKNNIALLLNGEYQVLLNCFLFEPGLLPKELATNKNLKTQIVSFLNAAILKHRSDLSLLSSGAFLYEVASFLETFMFDPEAKGQNEIEQLLTQIPNELKKFQQLEQAELLTEEQALAYGRLSKVYLLEKLKGFKKGSLLESELYELYAAYIKANQLALKLPLINESTKELDAKISEIFAFCEINLEKKFKEENFKNKILAHIVETSVPTWKLKNKFSGEFPVFNAMDVNGEAVSIDLKTGRCLKKSLEAGYIPEKIRRSSFFTEKFGDINPSALISVTEGSFEFKANGYERKLLTKSMRVLTKINDIWCQERIHIKDIPRSIQENYFIFDSDQTSFFEAKDKKDIFGLCAKVEPDGQKVLYLTESGVPTTYRLQSHQRRYKNIESNESAILIRHLMAFVDREDIEIYDNTTLSADNVEPPMQIKIPAYQLHFICKKYPDSETGKWHLFLKDKPNYRLILDIPKPSVIKDFSYWLPFEDVNSDPKEMYGLFPIRKFNGEVGGNINNLPSFFTQRSMNKYCYDEKVKKNKARKYLFCKIKPEKNKLIPESGAGLIYLAYVNLYQGDPFAAYKLLTSGQKDTVLLGTAQELEWLQTIIFNDEDIQEVFQRPENVSVKLQAIYLFIQNHLMQNPELLAYELKNKSFCNIFIQSMCQYFQVLNHVPKSLRLSEAVELTLLNFINNSNKLSFEMPSDFHVQYQDLLKTKKAQNVGWSLLEHNKVEEAEILRQSRTNVQGDFDNFLGALNRALETEKLLDREIVHTPYKFSIEKKPHETANNTLSVLYGLPSHHADIEDEKEAQDFISQDDLKKGNVKNNVEKKFRTFCDDILKPFLEKTAFEDDKEAQQKEQKTLLWQFEDDLDLQKNELDKLKREMLTYANKQLNLEKNTMRLLGKSLHKMTMQDLLALFLKNNIGDYHTETLLPMDENRFLHQMMYTYLLRKSHYNRLKKVRKDLLAWKVNPKDSQSLYDLGAHLYAKRHYEPHEDPDLLVLERYENILLREEQVIILKSLLMNDSAETKNKIIQLIMGGGKSKVIAPLLMRLNADENTLAVYRVPAALFETTLADLKRTYKKLFEKDVIPFKFSRAEPYSSVYLKNLFDQFLECMRQKNCILSMGNAMRSLGLKYYDLLTLLKQEPENDELWKQLEWVEELLALLKQKSYVLIDEADSELNIEEELNYPYGEEKGLDPAFNSAILDLHELLDREIKAKNDQPLKNLPELALMQNNSVLKKMLDKFKMNMTVNEKEETDKKIVQYLRNSSDGSVHAFVERLSEDIRDILAIYRYEIHYSLPVALQKRVDEHFGKTKIIKDLWDPVDEIPIPYVASQTPKEG